MRKNCHPPGALTLNPRVTDLRFTKQIKPSPGSSRGGRAKVKERHLMHSFPRQASRKRPPNCRGTRVSRAKHCSARGVRFTADGRASQTKRRQARGVNWGRQSLFAAAMTRQNGMLRWRFDGWIKKKINISCCRCHRGMLGWFGHGRESGKRLGGANYAAPFHARSALFSTVQVGYSCPNTCVGVCLHACKAAILPLRVLMSVLRWLAGWGLGQGL